MSSECNPPPQYLAYLEDRNKYGDHQEGVYKGLKWKAVRPVELNGLLHWNGYVELPRELTDDENTELENLAHGGITGGSLEMPGFDCAHYRDYLPGDHENQLLMSNLSKGCGLEYKYRTPDQSVIYRDFSYVRSVIDNMIDYLATLPN